MQAASFPVFLSSLLWAAARGQSSFADKAALKAAVDAYVADSKAAESQHGPIHSRDTSSVTDMGGMFHSAAAFNGDISRVTDILLCFVRQKRISRISCRWQHSR
jgi:hypothetical protein